MNDDNLFEEKCSCGATCKVVLPTTIGTVSEAKELLQRFDNWRTLHAGIPSWQ